MAHNVVLQAYERILQAWAHYLPYNVPLRQDPKNIEILRKVLEKLEKLCAKYPAVVHNKKDEKYSNQIYSFRCYKQSREEVEGL